MPGQSPRALLTALLCAIAAFTAHAAPPCASLNAPANPSSPTTLRVLTFNIHHGEGLDRQVNLARIADTISGAKPDLVALQEVDSGCKRSGNVDQPAELARLTGLHQVFGGNIRFQGGNYGNAVLARFPIIRHENYPLPSHYKGEQRGVLEVELRLPNGEQLTFFATHFDFRRHYDLERLASVHFVNELVAEHPKRLALLAGDFNARPTTNVLAELGTEWRRANFTVLPTYPAAFPLRQIDYVMVRPACRWRVREVIVLADAISSDHRPLLTILELRD